MNDLKMLKKYSEERSKKSTNDLKKKFKETCQGSDLMKRVNEWLRNCSFRCFHNLTNFRD